MPTEQLQRTLDGAGPDVVQRHRLTLIAASEQALAASNPACLLYAALASAISVDEPGLYPMLTAALLKVDDQDPRIALHVLDDLKSVDTADGVPLALYRELLAAMGSSFVTLHDAGDELAGLDTVPPDWTDDPKA